MPNEKKKQDNSALSLEELLALLKNEHGEEALTSNKKKTPAPADEESSLDGFEFDDAPIEADYLNYNRIGLGVSAKTGTEDPPKEDPINGTVDVVEELDDPVDETVDVVETVLPWGDVIDDPIDETVDVVEELDDPIDETVDIVEELDDPIDETVDIVEELDDPIDETVDIVEELDDPIDETVDVVEELDDPVDETVDILEELDDPIDETVDVVEELDDPDDDLLLDDWVLPEEPKELDEDETKLDEDDDGLPIFDHTEELGVVKRIFERKPKDRQKGSMTPIEDEDAGVPPEKFTVLPSERHSKEFTAYSQSGYIKEGYRLQTAREMKKFLVLVLLTAMAFVLENLNLVSITVLMPQNAPILSTVLSLVLTAAATAFVWKELMNGTLLLIRGKAIPESFLPFALAVPLGYGIYTLVSGIAPIMLFGFSYLLFLSLMKLQTIMRLFREAKTFRVVATEKPKRVFVPLSEQASEKEREAFSPYVSPDASYYTVKRTLFTKEYFQMTHTIAKNKAIVLLYPALALACAVLVFVVSVNTQTFAEALGHAFISLYYTLPFSALIVYEMPLLWAAFAASDKEAAIIGESAAEQFSKEGVVSFADNDLFSPSDIALTNILLFKETAVEKLLEYTALTFDEINSPVAGVVKRSVPEYRFDDPITLLGVYEGGLDVMINNERVLLGGYPFMLSNGIVLPQGFVFSETDQAQLFVAIAGELIGKLDFSYTVDRDTKGAFDYLERAGFYIALRTLDPNITHALLKKLFSYKAMPIELVRVGDDNERLRMRKSLSSSIVSVARTKALINAVVLAEKSQYTQKIGMILAFVSLLTGTLVMLLSVKLGSNLLLNGIGVALFQLFWLLPTVLLTAGYVKNRKKRMKK